MISINYQNMSQGLSIATFVFVMVVIAPIISLIPGINKRGLKRRNTLRCLDQYAAQNSKYARPPIPSQPAIQKAFFQWHTQYDPTMKHSHCETVYAKELFQLVHLVRILSILPTFKLGVSLKNANDVHKMLNLVWVWNYKLNWRSMSIKPKFGRDLNSAQMHFCSKFGNCNFNWWGVLAWTSSKWG